jgi:hypothetical protein
MTLEEMTDIDGFARGQVWGRSMSRFRALLLDARAVRSVAVVKLSMRLTDVTTGVAPLCHPGGWGLRGRGHLLCRKRRALPSTGRW